MLPLRNIYALLLVILMISCKQEGRVAYDVVSAQVNEASIDDVLADSLISFFTSDYLAKDMKFLEGDTTAFQFYKIDLNNDGEKEIFIRLMGPYFCSSSGCSYIVTNQDFDILNKFTSTKAPIIATHEYQNDWRVLVTEEAEDMKMLINKNNKYPSNPVMAPISNIPISRDDVRMFDEVENPSKTYFF